MPSHSFQFGASQICQKQVATLEIYEIPREDDVPFDKKEAVFGRTVVQQRFRYGGVERVAKIAGAESERGIGLGIVKAISLMLSEIGFACVMTRYPEQFIRIDGDGYKRGG